MSWFLIIEEWNDGEPSVAKAYGSQTENDLSRIVKDAFKNSKRDYVFQHCIESAEEYKSKLKEFKNAGCKVIRHDRH